MTYLVRYQQGEYEQVWAELVGLGARIRDPDLIAVATAVAHETMTRVAANVDILFQRLQELNYEFWHPLKARCVPSAEINKQLAEIEAQLGVLPLSLHTWYEVVGSVDFTGLFSPPQMKALFDERRPINSVIGELSDAHIRAMGRRQNPYFLYSDALLVLPLELLQEYWQPGEQWSGVIPDETDLVNGTAWWEQPNAPIAEEVVNKAGFSGGEAYRLLIPHAAIDGPVLNLPSCYAEQPPWNDNMWLRYPASPMYFVEYLRLCCRWGGFPGFAGDYSELPPLLTDLTRDLLPF